MSEAIAALPAPFPSWCGIVMPGWVDHNHHMNVSCYGIVFDQSAHAFMRGIGLGAPYRARTPYAFFVAETHVAFRRELRENAPLRVDTQFLGNDAKRVRLIHVLRHAAEGFVGATSEYLLLHVDRTTRRVAPMPPDVMTLFAALGETHGRLPLPEVAGRGITLPAMVLATAAAAG